MSLNLKQYYNSRFNEKIIKSFRKMIEILFICNCIYLTRVSTIHRYIFTLYKMYNPAKENVFLFAGPVSLKLT